MSANVWQFREARSRFSEIVERAIKHGAQTVTKHGKPAVVVISAEEYKRGRAPRKSLFAALRRSPEDLGKLVGRRSKEPARKIFLS